MKVQAVEGEELGVICSLSLSSQPSLPPWLFVSLFAPSLPSAQSVQLAESGSLLSTSPSNCLSHFCLLLFDHHLLSNSLTLSFPLSVSLSLSLSLSPSPFVSASLSASLPPSLPPHPPDFSPSITSFGKPSLTHLPIKKNFFCLASLHGTGDLSSLTRD